jgi:hypothetical protein
MNENENDIIPTVGEHRGVGLHDCQTPERLEIVRRAIDDVFDVADFRKLLAIAGGPRWPPEARLFAAAKLQAIHQIAADKREVRPLIDLELVRALVAGVNSIKWRDPVLFASLLDHSHMDQEPAVRRETPLIEAD